MSVTHNEAPDPRRWLVLFSVGVGTIMSPLDSSVVNIALPVITDVFNTTLAVSEWVAMAYLLTISSLLLTYGRLGDLFGFRNVYLGGFTIFTFSSLLCGLSPTIGYLIGFRVLQALGAGMMMAAGPAIITATFPPYERGRALGLNGAMVGIGLTIGPVLGGFLVQALGWRSIFMINLPIGIAGIWWALKILPTTGRSTEKRSFDVAGAITLFVALLSLLLALSHGEAWGWRSYPITGLWVLGILSFLVFLRSERRAHDPMVDLSLFRIRLFSAANASALLNFMSMFTVTFLTPFYLQNALGLPPNKAGLIMLASPIIMLVMAPISGSISDRLGSSIISPVGFAIVAGALWWMSTLTATSTGLDVMMRLFLIGLGNGLFQAPNNSAIMGSVPRARLGLASGMLATMRNIGMVLGIATSGAIFTARQAHYLEKIPGSGLSAQDAYVMGLQDTFMVGAAFALLGVAASLVRGRHNQPEAQGAKTT